MWRLKFLRILLPALLLPFIAVLVLTMHERPAPKTPSGDARPFVGPRAEGIELTDLSGGTRRGWIQARLVQADDKGRLRLEGIKKLVIDREAAPALVVSAERGGIEGEPGQRVMRLEGGVSVHEEEAGLALELPTLEVNEVVGEARSIGEVSVQDPTYAGRAASVVYGLHGQPTVLAGLEVKDRDGETLRAQHARLLDGSKDMDLSGEVRAQESGWTLTAGRLRIQRDAEGRLRHATAAESVVGAQAAAPDAATPRFAADAVEATWDASGHPDTSVLEGRARLEQAGSVLTADRIEAARAGRETTAAGWEVRAKGSVRVAGTWHQAPSSAQADLLTAELGGSGALLRAELEGNVRFDGSGTAGEAAHLVYVTSGRGQATLLSGPGRRARLARERTRVAADRLTTDPEGTELTAEGHVESTLLAAPMPASGGPKPDGLFVAGEAVHFVSARLTSRSAESRLVFEGEVRGWQEERNLSADHVEVRQQPEELHAKGSVNTRVPRERGASASEADYVRVAANQLDYGAAERKAVYTGSVRVRQAEGWLEAARVDVLLAESGGDVREMLASGSVRFEFHSSAGGTLPQPVTGEGDRVEYLPAESTVRLFGDEAPATIRRTGAQGGTTTGRVLRYRLDVGTIEVESGDRNRARIRTSER